MPVWLRCRDKDTGHEFDLSPEDIRIADGSVEVLTDYPENSSSTARPRPAKHRVDKAGQPHTPQAAEPAATTPAVTSANSKRSNANG